jgi:hypothetical protein
MLAKLVGLDMVNAVGDEARVVGLFEMVNAVEDEATVLS